MLEKLKRNLIRTPLERPALWLRNLAGARKRRKHPELSEIYAEGERMDAILARILKPDSNCLDVGAHIGSFLVQLIRLAPRGKHMAFEALPEKAEWLKKTIPLASNRTQGLLHPAHALAQFRLVQGREPEPQVRQGPAAEIEMAPRVDLHAPGLGPGRPGLHVQAGGGV